MSAAVTPAKRVSHPQTISFLTCDTCLRLVPFKMFQSAIVPPMAIAHSAFYRGIRTSSCDLMALPKHPHRSPLEKNPNELSYSDGTLPDRVYVGSACDLTHGLGLYMVSFLKAARRAQTGCGCFGSVTDQHCLLPRRMRRSDSTTFGRRPPSER